jgi:hypothetical protein
MRDWTLRPSGPGAEYSDGYGHRVAQNAIVDTLMRAGLPLFDPRVHSATDLTVRDNRQQVIGSGTEPGNVPDVSYMGADRSRVNVEVDTTPAGLRRHMRELIRRDPAARHVGVLVDPRTGQPQGQWVYDPRPGPPGRRGPVRIRRVDGPITLPEPLRPANSQSQQPPSPVITFAAPVAAPVVAAAARQPGRPAGRRVRP